MTTTVDHTLYDPGLRAALRAVQDYPTEEERLARIAQLDREAIRKGYRRATGDMSLMLSEANAKWSKA